MIRVGEVLQVVSLVIVSIQFPYALHPISPETDLLQRHGNQRQEAGVDATP